MELYFDSGMADDERRRQAYGGDIFLYASTPAGRALCQFAQSLLEKAFHPLEPRSAQHHLPVAEFAAILSELKPAFIHHEESKRLLQALLLERGCDPQNTYFDVPRLRSATSDGYLSTGIAYAFHPHRDTWYSAPGCQLNWWLPIYPLQPGSGMEIYPRYWQRPVRNSSRCYNYARWIRESRFNAGTHIKRDTREQPKPEEALDLAGSVSPSGEPGSLTLFSAAQLHASADNQSGECRFSVDFRTVHLDDVKAGKGAVNVDSECTGTALGDFLRVADLAAMPEKWVQQYDTEDTWDGG